MSSEKRVIEWGVLVEEETSYGGGATMVAAEDCVLALERPDVDPDFANDGARRGGSGPYGHGIKRVAKSGLYGSVPIVHEAAGAGAAYSATVKPTLNDLLQACGFDITLIVTEGSESYEYDPSALVGASVAAEIYNREQKYILAGCYADFTLSCDEGAVPVWEFILNGILTQPTEAAVPAITYPTTQPPKGVGISMNLGDFATAKVRSLSLALNRTIDARLDLNAADLHAGFTLGGMLPTLETVIEMDAFVASPFHSASGINPYQLQAAATALAVDFTIGSVKYNKFKIAAAAAQVVEVAEDEDGASGLWTLQWELNPTIPGLKDNFSILFD